MPKMLSRYALVGSRYDLGNRHAIVDSGRKQFATNSEPRWKAPKHKSILWFERKIQSITKGEGPKQECRLSPRLFTIVLDDVLRTLEELVSEVRMDQDVEIDLRVILTFADYIIIIGDRATVLTNIMKNLKELLISVSLNETKTKMLIRDPINNSIAKQTQEINGVLITPVDIIKYQSTYLTSELSRRDTIKTRCKQTIRSTKGLLPFKNQNALENSQVDLNDIWPKCSNKNKTEKDDSLLKDFSYHNKNQEEWATLAQNKTEMKKAADELQQLP
ncbi:hypothetical protein EVAR_85795_1 [Eumeta japonica]|uniref:Reverse transcriptase domain-containing protein n=1 Tax=Eumeta variegata TaxID=151549 RepID=A0A4C1URJ7_EUMVA|nr:hypothetical protein EVAR_85795_1 [Eumeta japonica]